MTLQYLDTGILQGYLVSAWEKQLNTSDDPANGQWYTNGPNKDNIGLYGGLTDTQQGDLQFVLEEQSSTPTATVFASATVSNLNGLNPSANTLNLSYAVQATLTTTHTNINTVKAGVKVEAKADFLVAGAKVTISGDYEHSWQDTSTTTTTYISTFTYSEPITVPAWPGLSGPNYRNAVYRYRALPRQHRGHRHV